jgi:hypothetical protein
MTFVDEERKKAHVLRVIKTRYLDEEQGKKKPTDRSVLAVRENPVG